MKDNVTDLVVQVSRIISTSQEKVFNAWLDPAMLSTFMLPKTGMPNPEVTIDPVVGGEYEIIMDVGDQKIPHHGKYLMIDPHHKIEFSWNSPFSGEGSVVSIEFREVDVSHTEVNLVHRKFPSEESRDNHEAGWTSILEMLANQV